MSNVTITWRGDQWLRSIVPALNAGLTAAASVGANVAAGNFGTEGGGVIGPGGVVLNAIQDRKKYRALSAKLKGKQRFQSAPPGAFPGVRTSLLRNSVAFVSPDALGTPLHAAFGTASKYGRWLEFGTSKMPARPWIVRSALMARPQMQATFARAAGAAMKAAGVVQ